MYKLFMALRYLRAHRIIYFSIAGVAIGVLVIIITSSIMGGFSRDLRARIRGMQADLTLTTVAPDLYLPRYEKLTEEIGSLPHVRGAAPRLEYDAWLGMGGSRLVIHLVGIVPEAEAKTSRIGEFFERGGKTEFNFRYDDGRPQEHPGMVMGAERFRISRSPMTTGALTVRDSTPPRFLNGKFQIVGSFRTGMSEYDSGAAAYHAGVAFVHLESMQEFLDVEGANGIAITLDDYEKNVREARRAVLDVTHRLRPCNRPENHELGRCGIYRTVSWEEAKQILLQAVSTEKGIMWLILFFIVLVAGFNIMTIYTLMVRAKTRDVGILKALGASEGGITTVFLVSGTVCGLVGCVLGILGGIFLAHNINAIADFIELQSVQMNRLGYHSPESGGGPSSAEWAVGGSSVLLVLAALAGMVRFFRMRRPFRSGLFLSFGVLNLVFLGILVSRVRPERPMELAAVHFLHLSFWVGLVCFFRFFGPKARGDWFWAGASGLAMAAASWFTFAWMRQTGALREFGVPPAPGESPTPWSTVFTVVLVSCVAFPFAMMLLKRAALSTVAGGLRFSLFLSSCVVWVAVLLCVLGGFAMSLAIFVNDFPYFWVGFNLFPKDIYYLERIPVYVDWTAIGSLVGITLVVSLVFSIYPANRAASLDPIEAIREE